MHARTRIHGVVFALGFAALPFSAGAAPTPKFALSIPATQSHVEYDRPAADIVAKCTVTADKYGKGTALFVRSPEGVLLRRFADSNGDDVVDQWSYFRDGLEVYRDIDSDFDREADQFRWLNTGGTRWGVDQDKDGQIDAWRQISAHEVAEELVVALQTRDPARFSLLIPTERQLRQLGLSKAQTDELIAQTRAAAGRFQSLTSSQKLVTGSSEFIDFGASKPGVVPAGTNDSTKDVTVYENVSALVSTGGDNKQIYVGTLVETNSGWRLLDAPTLDDSDTSGTFSFAALASTGADTTSDATAPSAEMSDLMDKLQRLDAEASRMPPQTQAALTDQRADLLERLAKVTPDPELRTQWYQQLAEMLSAAVQVGGYDRGVERLARLATSLQSDGADDNLLAYVRFRRLLASNMLAQQQPNPDFAKIQDQWLAELEEFADTFPNSPDAAEALLQLGMSQEFGGSVEDADKWYRRVVDQFPDTDRAKKAAGALRRLQSEGKPFRLRGRGLQGGQIDLAQYKGKLTLVRFWATWSETIENSKADLALLKELYAKHARRGFEVVGVCLDDDPNEAKQFLQSTKLPWQQIYEPGGLDGRLANEMGVMTLPLMILVDKSGQVARQNINAAEVDAEIQRRLR